MGAKPILSTFWIEIYLQRTRNTKLQLIYKEKWHKNLPNTEKAEGTVKSRLILKMAYFLKCDLIYSQKCTNQKVYLSIRNIRRFFFLIQKISMSVKSSIYDDKSPIVISTVGHSFP